MGTWGAIPVVDVHGYNQQSPPLNGWQAGYDRRVTTKNPKDIPTIWSYGCFPNRGAPECWVSLINMCAVCVSFLLFRGLIFMDILIWMVHTHHATIWMIKLPGFQDHHFTLLIACDCSSWRSLPVVFPSCAFATLQRCSSNPTTIASNHKNPPKSS